MKLIAYSREDIAGGNIAKVLREGFGFSETAESFDETPVFEREGVLLVESADSILYRTDFGGLNPELLIVASRHRSESGEPTLTTHVTGNFSSADVGGLEGKLSIAPAHVLAQAHELLKLNVGALPYRVSLEVTHHGPSELPFPLIFVEVGSSERQWRDDDACTVVAEVIDKLLFEEVPEKPAAIGFGGPHYAPNFSQITDKIALGHIAPKYAVQYVDEELVKQMIERTTPRPELAVLDWKGLKGAERRRITEVCENLGLKVEKSSAFK